MSSHFAQRFGQSLTPEEVYPLGDNHASMTDRFVRSSLLVALAALAILEGGCGSDEPGPPQAPADLPEGRKLVIFEPGPVALLNPARDEALDEIVELGVDTVRLVVFWNQVAPEAEPVEFDPSFAADPAYRFDDFDDFIRAAEQRSLKVLVTISGPPPAWATRGDVEGSAPDTQRFGEFARAVASRYGGGFDPDGDGEAPFLPAATMWSVWNEPNLSIFLQPQLRDREPYSPVLYRGLYLAAQEAIQAVDAGTPILIGETAPTRGLDSVDPIPFAEGVLCLDPLAQAEPVCNRGEIDAAGWATHPYGPADTPPFEDPPGPDFVTLPSLANLEQILDEAAEAGSLAPNLPVYITEYGVQSKPDPLVGVPLQTQADYLSIAERLAYADPRIRSYAQYLMRDDPPDRAPGVRFGGFESGLRFFDGHRKPSLASFRLPLVVRREGEQVSIWGLVRPAAGPTEVEVHVADGGRERLLRRLQTDRAGIFELESEYRDGRLWQLRWTDPDGEDFRGPWTQSYEFELPEPAGG